MALAKRAIFHALASLVSALPLSLSAYNVAGRGAVPAAVTRLIKR